MTKVFLFGVSKPLVEEGVAKHFTPVRVAGNTNYAAIPKDVANDVRGLATGGGHDKIDAALFNHFPKLEIVASFGVGYDHIDAAEAARRGIVVTHTPNVLTEDVADIAIALLLSSVRQLGASERYLRAGKWAAGPFPLTFSLRERKVGILGYGRIGKAIHRRLAAFDVPVAYTGRTKQAGVDLPYYPDVMALAKAVDTIIVAAPGGAGTKHLINREVLKVLGPKGIIVNIGRGSVVDEAALAQALLDGTTAAAGLDVFEHEPKVHPDLLKCENAVLLPHVASASHYTRDAMARLVVENLVVWFGGKGAVTPVPECEALSKGKIK